MKTIKYTGGLVGIVLALAFVSCDDIKEKDRLIDQGIVEVKSERCVLLEDYTGVRCVNCPNAAAEIKLLQAAYGSNLIVVGIYPQNPSGLTRPYDGSPDLRTEVAQTYATEFQIPQYPMGMINRKGDPSTFQAWGGKIQDVFDDTASDCVNLLATARLSGTNMEVGITGNFKKDYDVNGDIGIVAMVVEDDIKAEQLMPETMGGGTNPDYIHNHVLRAVISEDIWGDGILDAFPTEGTSFDKQYTAVLDESWQTQNLALVALVVNLSTREVLQAAYAHLSK